MVSMKDIANKLGVSRTTVSNILNGNTKNYSYRDETIKLVKKTAKEMGYVMNHVAASLKTGKTQTIAIIVPDVANSFYLNIIKEAERLSKEDDYNLIVCISEEDLEKENQTLEMLRSRMVDGIIISPVSYKYSLRDLEQLPPIICFDRIPEHYGIPSVTIKNSETAEALTRKIRERGVRNILFMGGNDDDSTNIRRFEGVLKGMADCDAYTRDYLFGIFTEEQAYQALKQHCKLKRAFPYDAVFLTTNHLIYGVLRVADECNLPLKSIAGFEDFYGSKLITSKISMNIEIAVQPEENIALEAYQMLLQAMNKKPIKNKKFGKKDIKFISYN